MAGSLLTRILADFRFLQRNRNVPDSSRCLHEYLESRNARIGPDFEDSVAYMFPIIQRHAGKRDSLQANTLANWADRYLHSDLGADLGRRAQRRTDELRKWSEWVRAP